MSLNVQAFFVLLTSNSIDSDQAMAYQNWYSNDHYGADTVSTCSGSRDDHSEDHSTQYVTRKLEETSLHDDQEDAGHKKKYRPSRSDKKHQDWHAQQGASQSSQWNHRPHSDSEFYFTDVSDGWVKAQSKKPETITGHHLF